MADSTPIATPADPHVPLLKSPSEPEADTINQEWYHSAVLLLMYAMIGTRPDMAFTVSTVSQHNTNPGDPHWTASWRIFRYLAGTMEPGLHYGRGIRGGYCDGDWGGAEDWPFIG